MYRICLAFGWPIRYVSSLDATEIDGLLNYLDRQRIHPEWTTSLLAIIAAGGQRNEITPDCVSAALDIAGQLATWKPVSELDEWMDNASWDIIRQIGKK